MQLIDRARRSACRDVDRCAPSLDVDRMDTRKCFCDMKANFTDLCTDVLDARKSHCIDVMLQTLCRAW